MNDDQGTDIVLSRRRVLVFGTAAVGVLTAAYASLRQVGRYPSPELELQTLSNKEVAVMRRLGEFLVPRSELFPGHGGDDETIVLLDGLLYGMPQHKRSLVRALPLVFEHGTSLDRFGSRCMSKMPDERCDAYLEGWANHEEGDFIVRAQLWAGLKTLWGMTYWERQDVMEAMGTPIACQMGA